MNINVPAREPDPSACLGFPVDDTAEPVDIDDAVADFLLAFANLEEADA